MEPDRIQIDRSPLLDKPSVIEDPSSFVPVQDKRISLLTLILLNVALVGVQFAWSVELSIVTPYFKVLGLSETLNHLVWAAGPISGFIVSPTVGVLSDRSTARWGRRRPYILGGLIFVVASMILFSNSKELGEAIGDKDGDRKFAIGVAFAAFLFMDLSINAVQTPIRALVSDLASRDQQNLGQSIATLMQGIGAVSGNVVCYVFDPPTDRIRWIFMVGYGLLIVCVLITLYFGKETAFVLPPDAPKQTILDPFKTVARGVMSMSREMIMLCVVQFFAWMAWFTFLPNASSWMGTEVYGGNGDAADGSPERKLFDDGVRFNSLGNIGQAVVQVAFSFAIPFLVRFVGLKPVYFTSYLVFAGALLGMSLTRNKWVAFALISVTGLPFATTNIFPFSLVGQYFREESQQGLNMGILNWFIVIPQLLDTAWTGTAASARPHGSLFGGDSLVLFVGSIVAVIAAFVTFLLHINPKLQADLSGGGGGH